MADTEEIFGLVNTRMRGMGIFDTVLRHEPKSAPNPADWTWGMWAGPWRPLGGKSGLASTSMVWTIFGRVYHGFLQEPAEDLETDMMARCDAVLRECSSHISFGISDQGIWTDLLGDETEGVFVQPGYLRLDKIIFRTADISIPVIMTDYFTQSLGED